MYTIGILDFVFADEAHDQSRDVFHRVQLKDHYNRLFYGKLTFIYLTLPNSTKTVEQLESLQDKWFFLFRHLHELDEIPPRLREKVFLSLLEKASIARFQPEERQAYESSLKYYRDLKNVIDTARKEGHLVTQRATAQAMVRDGHLDDATVTRYTGLSLDDIARRRKVRDTSGIEIGVDVRRKDPLIVLRFDVDGGDTTITN